MTSLKASGASERPPSSSILHHESDCSSDSDSKLDYDSLEGSTFDACDGSEPESDCDSDEDDDKLAERISKLSRSGYSIISAEHWEQGASSRIIKVKISAHNPRDNESSSSSSSSSVTSHTPSNKEQLAVFRLAKFPAEHENAYGPSTKHQATLLAFLRGRELGFNIPRVFEYDVRDENPIGFDSLLIEYISAIPLESIYRDLPLDEKLKVVRSIVEVLVGIESVTFAKAGRLMASDGTPSNLEYRDHFGFDGGALVVMGLGVGDSNCVVRNEPTDCLRDLIYGQFDSWEVYEKGREARSGAPSVRHRFYTKLRRVTVEMGSLGYFDETEGFCITLYHEDLYPRNILVQQTDDSSDWGKIVSVIDWDDALALPTKAARIPPTWLWDPDPPVWTPEQDAIGSDIDGDPDLYDHAARFDGLSEDNQAVKMCFDAAAEEKLGKDYLDDAYGKGRWIRRLARFLVDGFGEGTDFTRCKKFLKEWRAEHPLCHDDVGTDGESCSDSQYASENDDDDESWEDASESPNTSYGEDDKAATAAHHGKP